MLITPAFRAIHDPVVTGVPPVNPHRDFMKMPDGELRHYGVNAFRDADGTIVLTRLVAKSDDCGLNWRTEVLTAPTVGAMTLSPWSGEYLTILHCRKDDQHRYVVDLDSFYDATDACPSEGVYCFRAASPDGPFRFTKICSEKLHIQRQMLPLRHRKRWVQTFQCWCDDGIQRPGVLISDDDGITWTKKILPAPPLHEIAWPHKGYRWRQPGSEPVVAEAPDGRLILLLRTSQDKHYWMFSLDSGDSWSDPQPSPFYSVATMPNLVTLSDGRMLAVWNNTTPLPETDHCAQPILSESEINGESEDVFTNRDALHAAISEDGGEHWIGFREIHLNECRNDGDFRSSGGSFDSLDKSVHQNEVIELPENKVIVAFGQHVRCRKFVIFDLGFLYDTGRSDDFTRGLDGWSLQLYYKSIYGNYRGITGHCSFNRRQGAALIPHPDGEPREVLQIGRHPDSRLLSEKEGAVWNFPAADRGEIALKLRLERGSAGIRILLTDRWFNPSDPVVEHFAVFGFELDGAGRINEVRAVTPGEWVELKIRYDQNAHEAVCFVDGRETCRTACRMTAVNAVSYLHLQTPAEGADPFGVLLESVAMRKASEERK